MSNLLEEVKAKCVWGEGPRDILLTAENAFVFGPLVQHGLPAKNGGWASVQIDLTKEQAQLLICQLQQAIEQTETIEDQVIRHCQGDSNEQYP